MKKYIILVLTVLLIGTLTVSVMGKSNVAHLYLYEKTDDGTMDWPVVEGGAWGKMKYNTEGEEFEFVFNGHGLEAGEDYTLIYYPDPWPGDGLICLGEGTANGGGEVHIAGSCDTGNLPAAGDEAPLGGAKIWLVLSEDIDCGVSFKNVWNLAEYLFEGDVIEFNDTDTP